MKKKTKIVFSVIIVNYNNKKFISRCVNSLNNQSYKSFEVIFVDDKSTDNSLNHIKKISKKIKVIKKNKKTNTASFDQMDSYFLGLSKAKGKYICFLDSDDFFKKNKLKEVSKLFDKNRDNNIAFDLPFLYFNNKKFYKYKIKSRGTLFTPWPRFSPQSCISVRKDYLKKILKKINIKKFPTIWLDFRLAYQAYIDFEKIIFIEKYLTYYQQSNNSASSKYKRFSRNWWKRRNEAHKFAKYLMKKNGKMISNSLDQRITNFVNNFF